MSPLRKKRMAVRGTKSPKPAAKKSPKPAAKRSPKRAAKPRSPRRVKSAALEGGAWWCLKFIPACRAAADKKAADLAAANKLLKKIDYELENDPFLARYRVYTEFRNYSLGTLGRSYYMSENHDWGDQEYREARKSCSDFVKEGQPTQEELKVCLASTSKLENWLAEKMKGKAEWEKSPDTAEMKEWYKENYTQSSNVEGFSAPRVLSF